MNLETMIPSTRKRFIEERFHELAVKSALGKTSVEEENKLDRYQALRRPKRTAAEIRAEAKAQHEVKGWMRKLRAAVYQRSNIKLQTPNI